MSRSFEENTPQSSHDFIRALRAVSDPPIVGGPSKIQIAQAAWDAPSVYIPNKSEVIGDWTLMKLLKDKGKEIALNPLFDARYWQLIISLCNDTRDSSAKNYHNRSPKAWLKPLLHRIPLGPVVIAFLTSFNQVDDIQKDELGNLLSSALAILWPISVQRTSTEILQECLGALLFALSSGETSEGISRTGKMVSTSYHNSLINSSNKKKLYLSFLQSHLRNWIQCLEYTSHDPSLYSAVLDAGVETLFNLDILRQIHDYKAEESLVERLRKFLVTDRDIVFGIIPVIFSCYISAIKKNRGALFSQGSRSQAGALLEEQNEAGLRYFMLMFTLVDNSHQDCRAWETRLSLLQTVDRENIFDGKQVESQMTFNQIIELILVALADGWKEDSLERTGLAVQCLSTIARIDYDLIMPFIPRLLFLLAQIPVPSESHFVFLDILLNYHTKTRTMGTFVQNLFSSISGPTIFRNGSRDGYQLFFSSPLLHTFFLDRLSKALLKFLTESQCIPTLNLVFNTLRNVWASFCSGTVQLETDPVDGPRKKRKRTDTDNSYPEDLAVTYCLVCRLASVVLSSLPMSSLALGTLNQVRGLLIDFRAEFIYHATLKLIKVSKKQTDADVWSPEVAIASTLKLLYALDISRNLSLPHHQDEKMVKKLTALMESDHILPELTLELYRTLLSWLSSNNSLAHEDIINHLLQYLEHNFTATDVRWSGSGHHLTKGEPGRAECALAIMHMVIQRWLPVLEQLASVDQLEKFLKIILSINLPATASAQQMQPEQVLMELLHSAQFWEFRNIRNVFADLIDQMTVPLDTADSKRVKSSLVLEGVSIYRRILFFPMEYFSSPLLNDLIKRCLAADIALSRLPPTENGDVSEVLIVLRVFLKRAYFHCGSVSQDLDPSDFLLHLLQSIPQDTGTQVDFTQATLDLAEIYFSNLLKTSKKTKAITVLEVLASFKPDLFCKSLDIPALTFISFVNLLEQDFPSNSLPEELVAAIGKLHQEISISLQPRIDSVFEGQEDLKTCANISAGWYTLLCLQKWLPQTGNTVLKLVGEKLASNLLSRRKNGESTNELDGLCVNAFAILLQELDSRSIDERSQPLDFIVAVYISLADVLSSPDDKNLDLHFSKACRKMSISDYSHTLSSVSANLDYLSHTHLLHLVHLAALVLREHPTHSLTYVKNFATSCINSFNKRPVFVEGSIKLRLQVLEVVLQYCSDQQAALSSLDVAGIWSLLFKYLAPSQARDEGTEVVIFHNITSIISSLIRLRRDLVTHVLPHLGMILRQLISSLRACRPNLGGKQTALVMATQPRWVSATHPLGAGEAKVLARLLESINTKTTVRFLATSSLETQKAESLAKPFSKHAAYVLEAYIEAMNDPLCVLSLEVRKELQPGLFALCGMVSEHSRDSLMSSALDVGGKMTLKALWKEYEKQRYVGKG